MKTKFFILSSIILLVISLFIYKNLLHDNNQVSTLNQVMSPEETVFTAFEALKNENFKEFNKLVDYKTERHGAFVFKDNKLFGDNLDSDDKEFLDNLFLNFSYKVKSSKTTKDTATVQVQITNRDFSNALKNIIYYAHTNKPLIEAIKNTDSNVTTSDLEILLKRTNGMWKIQMNTDLTKAISGGL